MGQNIPFHRQEDRSEFEQSQTRTEPGVVFQQFEHGCHGAAAHGGAFGRNRVLKAHISQPFRRFFADIDSGFAFRRGLAVGQGILQTNRDQYVTNAFFRFQTGVADLRRQFVAQALLRNALVTVDTHDLFDQVSLPDDAGFDICACGWALGNQLAAFHPAGETQPFKDPHGFLQRDLLPNHLANGVFRQTVDGIFIRSAIVVQHAPHHYSAAPFLHALQAEAQRGFCQRRMHITAEAVSRLAADAGLAEGFAQVDEVPVCRLDQQVAGAGVDAGFAAAHHARDGKRSNGVGHEFHLGVELRLRTIQQGDLFARLSRAGDDGRLSASPPAQQVVIEGVQRLTDLEHGVVGGIHQRVNRAHARERKPSLHPVRAFSGLGAFHHTQHEAGIELRVAHFQPDFFRDCSAFFHGNTVRKAQRSAQNG